MKTFAYITAVIMIIIGLIVMFGGLTLGIIGIVNAGSRALGATPVQPGLRFAATGLFGRLGGLILLVFVLIQGLMIVAVGEGLFLLADLTGKMIPPSANESRPAASS